MTQRRPFCLLVENINKYMINRSIIKKQKIQQKTKDRTTEKERRRRTEDRRLKEQKTDTTNFDRILKI